MYKNDPGTREIMLCALLHRPWKDEDFITEEEHGYKCPISVMYALEKQGWVVHSKGVWTLAESAQVKARGLLKSSIFDSLVQEHGGKIAHKEVEDFSAVLVALESLRAEGKVERRGKYWRVKAGSVKS